MLLHLFQHNLLSDKQHYTGHAVLSFSTDVIYFDFSKAFDTVPHNRLLNKLRGYGVDGRLLEWLEWFLTNRHQHVWVNGSLSSWTRVVPQWSVLSPLLFALYINDLLSLVSSLLLLFADDIKLYQVIRPPDNHIHTDYVTNKANCTLGPIYKVFECKDFDIVLKLYS